MIFRRGYAVLLNATLNHVLDEKAIIRKYPWSGWGPALKCKWVWACDAQNIDPYLRML